MIKIFTTQGGVAIGGFDLKDLNSSEVVGRWCRLKKPMVDSRNDTRVSTHGSDRNYLLVSKLVYYITHLGDEINLLI